MLTYTRMLTFDTAIRVNFDWHFCKLLTTVIVKSISSDLCRESESYVSRHTTSKHQCTRLGSVPIYPIQTVKQAALLASNESFHIIFENRRRNVISLNPKLEEYASGWCGHGFDPIRSYFCWHSSKLI